MSYLLLASHLSGTGFRPTEDYTLYLHMCQPFLLPPLEPQGVSSSLSCTFSCACVHSVSYTCSYVSLFTTKHLGQNLFTPRPPLVFWFPPSFLQNQVCFLKGFAVSIFSFIHFLAHIRLCPSFQCKGSLVVKSNGPAWTSSDSPLRSSHC